MRNSKGFTLIEFLVTISIISLLSSIVFTALSGAKAKAKDALIKQEFSELEKLMMLNYNDYGDYCYLQAQVDHAWAPVDVGADCDASFSDLGIYKTQAKNICKKITDNASGTSQKLYTRTASGLNPPKDCNTSYSFMAILNDGNIYCMGSSGRKGEYGDMTSPGCYNNP